MSRKPKNNHYHYAEQYSDRRYMARRNRRIMVLPKRFILLAAALVLLFTVITATFSFTDTEAETAPSGGGSLIVRVRNTKVAQDYMVTDGMEKEEAYAMTGANADLAVTGSNPASASAYYYSGSATSWAEPAAGHLMTNVDNVYCYRSLGTLAAGDYSFKVFTTTGWNNTQSAKIYSDYYTTTGNVKINNINPSYNNNGDNNVTSNMYFGMSASTANVYLLAFYPNTTVNSNSYAVCCLYQATSTSQLPRFADKWDLQGVINSTDDSTWSVLAYDINSTSYSATLTSNTSSICKVTNDYVVTKSGTKSVIETNSWYGYNGSITYANKSRTLSTSVSQNLTVTAAALGGTHTFSFNSSTKALSVAYPSYTVTTSKNPAAGSASSPTPASSTVAIGSAATVTAPAPATGYRFVNWTVTAGTVKTGSYASGTAITSSTTQSNLTVYPYGTAASVNLRANYALKVYTITYDKGAGSPVSGTIGGSQIANGSQTHFSSTQITSSTYSREGYTQVGWATTKNYNSQSSGGGTDYYDFGDSYSGNENVTLYPVWRLNAPTKYSDSSAAPSLTGGTCVLTESTVSFDLSPSVSDCPDDATRSFSFTTTGPAGATFSVETDPDDADFGKLITDQPGEYTVYMTVTDTNEDNGVVNTNYQASASSGDPTDPLHPPVTVSVKPNVPDFSITAHNVLTEDGKRDGTTVAKAYMIMLGERYYFSAAVDSAYLTSHPVEDYTYTWSTDESFDPEYIIDTDIDEDGTPENLTSIDFIDDGTSNYRLITYPTVDPEDPDPRSVEEVSDGGTTRHVTLFLRAERNDVSNDTLDKNVYYFIQPLIKSFEYAPFQKIFNMNDQTVSLAAQYNIGDDPSFTTQLKFSSDNNTYTNADAPSSGFIQSFVNAIRAYLYPTGPKFFYILMDGYNAEHNPITSRSDIIHTTVGTSDSSATRTLYFDNNTGEELKNYLVMCYYIDGSDNLCYQAAQDLKLADDADGVDTNGDNGIHYRVMIPANAKAVRFGFVAMDNNHMRYYGTPTLSAGTISGFATPIYDGYTDQVTLTDTTRKITATASTTIGSLKRFTCSSGGY